jgi:hypothetical protein
VNSSLAAKETGANTFIVGEVGDGALLKKAVSMVSARLKDKYTVGFLQPASEALSNLRLEVVNGENITAQVVGGGSVQVRSAAPRR